MKKSLLRILALALTLLSLSAQAETLDEYFTCRFSWSPAVYTGPSDTYFRAGSRKAQYGSPGKARVYGQENGWWLIGYQTGSGQYRLGYIDGARAEARAYDSSYGAVVRDLTFDYEPVETARACELTDDPVISRAPIDSLPAGQECFFLATLDNSWAYIELRTGAEWKRGFVPLDALTISWRYETPAPTQPPVVTAPPIPTYAPWPPASYAPPQPTAAPWNYVYPSAGFSGVWAVASQRLATRAGPSPLYSDTGTYFLQNQMVLVLAKHFDETNGVWWVKCRIEASDGTARALWTGVKRFFNQDWLLAQLPVE